MNFDKHSANRRVMDFIPYVCCVTRRFYHVTKDIPAYSLVGAGLNNILSSSGQKHVKLYLSKEL